MIPGPGVEASTLLIYRDTWGSHHRGPNFYSANHGKEESSQPILLPHERDEDCPKPWRKHHPCPQGAAGPTVKQSVPGTEGPSRVGRMGR